VVAARRLNVNRFVAQTCRESYWQFFLEFWPTVDSKKFKPNWHVKELCDELQHIAELIFADKPKEYDLVWNCPPGTTKSKVASVLWHPWCWSRMPSFRMISGSYAERLSMDLARQSRDCVTSEKYQSLFPEITLREDQNTKSMFMNTLGGWRFSTGVGGSAMGMHAHAIVVDDPINAQEALSDMILNEANVWISESLADRKVDKMLTPTILIQQRLHQNDPSGMMLDRGGRIKHRCLPCDTSWDVVPEQWKDHYTEIDNWPVPVLDPERLPASAMIEAQARGEAYYAGQYGQSPIPRGGAMFKVNKLVYSSTLPNRAWKRGPIRYWDKAGTKSGGAFTVGVKMAMDWTDRIWILDVVRGQWDSGQREIKILAVARNDGKDCRIVIEQEPGASGQESAERALKIYSLQGFRAKADAVKDSKDNRADSFSTQVNIGNVTVFIAPWNKDFIEEYRYFPVSKYKDQVDAGSGCYTQLTKTRLKIGAV
jgi:predicted phage terminase large subunit-like protein